MKKKLKLIYRVGKSGVRKIGRGEFEYRGKSIFKLPVATARYAVKHGPKKIVRRLKDEIIQIDRRGGLHLAFPNGLVSGVDSTAIMN